MKKTHKIESIVDLNRYPLNQPDSEALNSLIVECQARLEMDGLFDLPGLLKPDIVAEILNEVKPLIENDSFNHKRRHNIYFLPELPGVEPGHPALKQFQTENHTVCADQIPNNPLLVLYHWQPFIDFLASIMAKPAIYPMDDDLSCLNVMAHKDGEALNWHFDRSEFTTTLLLQAPNAGGEFQYKTGLRTDNDPNYDAIGEFLQSDFSTATTKRLSPGTLNVFKGTNTLHRVSPVQGPVDRIITIFTYYERPGKRFSAEEQIGFYGRSNV